MLEEGGRWEGGGKEGREESSFGEVEVLKRSCWKLRARSLLKNFHWCDREV